MLKDWFNNDYVFLGKKRVKVQKLTVAKWRELFSVVDKLPGLIIQVLMAPKEDFYAYVLNALDISFEEFARVVSILSGVDEDYIIENVGIADLFEYLSKTVKLNRLDDAVKNVKSLLPKE